MMLLDPTIIRDELGFDDMTDINDAITGAVQAATASLSAALHTSFDAGTHTDTWFVEAPLRKVAGLCETEFRLTYGFVQTLTSFGYSTYANLLGTSEALNSLSDVVLSAEKGSIRDFTTDYTRTFARAVYTHGFAVDDANQDVYDQEQVPQWLKEAAKMQALVLLANSPALKQAGIDIDTYSYASLKQQGPGTVLQAILAQHARYMPLAILPL